MSTNSDSKLATIGLPELAKKINDNHANVVQLYGDAVRTARECGEALLAAKQQVPHGEFGKWIDDNCSYVGRRQAQKYLRLHREWPAIERAAEGEIRSIDSGLALIALPNSNAHSTTHLDDDVLWDLDDAVPVAVANDRISSAVGGGSGKEIVTVHGLRDWSRVVCDFVRIVRDVSERRGRVDCAAAA